eukprot:Skav213201  [mRNA]  locus=scaffold2826:375883:385109:- [translate_table: standard]
MSQRRSSVLKDKKLALFEKLIIEAGHQDIGLIQDLTRGFGLTGELPKSGVFDRHLRPAKVSCDNLRTYAKVSRDSILKTVSSSGEEELDRGLWEATLKEVGKGFLEGPVEPASMPPESLLTKRFPVRQKNKIRPIDDYKANMVNQSVTQTEGVTIHTIDHIASMVAYWLRASSSLDGRAELVAKCWDLSDAYKQIPLSDDPYSRDAFLAVYCPDSQKAEVFRQKVLPFGSIASVTAFLRVSLALWAVGNAKLKLAWSAYFDDFLSLSEKASSKHTDLCISAMFSFLGWKLSEDKLLPFDSVCKVLGVRLDLSNAKFGIVKVSNTPGRVEELVGELNHVIRENRLSRKDGEKLRGRLQFASSQLFGRSFRKYLKELNNHLASGRKVLTDRTKSAIAELRQSAEPDIVIMLVGNKALRIVSTICRVPWMASSKVPSSFFLCVYLFSLAGRSGRKGSFHAPGRAAPHHFADLWRSFHLSRGWQVYFDAAQEFAKLHGLIFAEAASAVSSHNVKYIFEHLLQARGDVMGAQKLLVTAMFLSGNL